MTTDRHHHRPHHRAHHGHPQQAKPAVEAVASASDEQVASALPITDVSDQSLSLAERKAQLLERIERQRLLRQTRRIQAAIAQLQQAKGQGASPGDTGFPRSKTLRLITGQPALVAGAAGVLLMLGPTRLLRLASWVVPMLLRRR